MTIEEYIERQSTAENEVLAEITRSTNVHVLNPHMLSGQVQGRVLSFMSQMLRPKRILELGTFTGYSALCLAEGLSEDGELITIEHNDELEETIRHNLALSPLGDKIHLIISDAKAWLTEFGKQLSTIDSDGNSVRSTHSPLPSKKAVCIESAKRFSVACSPSATMRSTSR